METGFRKWIIVITIITATIIELIDTTIVNVSINTMSGNLGATLEDVAWVVTSYAIANVIIIPMTLPKSLLSASAIKTSSSIDTSRCAAKASISTPSVFSSSPAFCRYRPKSRCKSDSIRCITITRADCCNAREVVQRFRSVSPTTSAAPARTNCSTAHCANSVSDFFR